MEDFDAFISGVKLLTEFSGFGKSGSKGKWMKNLRILESGKHAEQLTVLHELSSFLSYASDDVMLGFPSWNYMNVLVHNIKYPEMKYCKAARLLADRAPATDDTSQPSSQQETQTQQETQSQNELEAKSPFFDLINAIYNNRIRPGQPDTDQVPAASPEQVPTAPTDRNNEAQESKEQEQNEAQPNESEQKEQSAPEEEDDDDEHINEEMAANKAIMSATCLNTLLDIMPHSAGYFMSHPKQLEILKEKLQDIQYIDLAESILLIYEKLVREIPVTIVRSNSLVAMLQFVDFFPTDVQIGTYNSVMYGIKKIERADTCNHYLIPILPYMVQALESGNKKIVQLGCLGLKMIVKKCINASKMKEPGADVSASLLVRSVLACNAIKSLSRHIIPEKSRLRGISLNHCMYCIAILTNESNEALANLFQLDVLQLVSSRLTKSPEATLIKLVDLGLALLGSYFSITPMSENENVIQRSKWFGNNPDQLLEVVATFPVSLLMDISDAALCQHLHNRIMVLQWRILEIAIERDVCQKIIKNDLPFGRLIESVCAVLRYQVEEEQSNVAIHMLMCLFKLVERNSLLEALVRHGVPSLLDSANNAKLRKEIGHIPLCIPTMNINAEQKSGLALINELKTRGDSMTMFEIMNSGILSLDYEKILSVDSLRPFLLTVTSLDETNTMISLQDLDLEGICSLWNSFARTLETQREFMFRIKEKIPKAPVVKKPKKTVENEECIELPTDHIDENDEAPAVDMEEANLYDPSQPAPSSRVPPTNPVNNTEQPLNDMNADQIVTDGNLDSPEDMNTDTANQAQTQVQDNPSIDSSTLVEQPNPELAGNDDTVEALSGAILKEVVTRPIDMLMNLYNEFSNSQSRPRQEAPSSPQEPNAPSGVPEVNSATISSDGNTARNRLRGAFGLMKQAKNREILPFPLSHMDRDLRLKMKCMNKIDEIGFIPAISVYTSAMVSVAKLEAYVLGYLNKRIRKHVEGSAFAQKKRPKMEQNNQKELDAPFAGIQIYYKGMALAPTTPLYQVICASRLEKHETIWDETTVIHYEVLRYSDDYDLQYLERGRYTPLMSFVCNDRHSAVELYMNFMRYVNGHNGLTNEEYVAHLKEQLSSLHNTGSPSKVQAILDKAGSLNNANKVSELGSQHIVTMPTNLGKSSQELAPGLVAKNEFNESPLDYLSGRIRSYLERFDAMWKGEKDLDALVATSPFCDVPEELDEESRRQIKMLGLLNALMAELEVFVSDVKFNLKYSKRLTLKLLTMLGRLDNSLCYRIPAWIRHLVTTCPRLFSLEARRLLFDLLTTGPQRVMVQFITRLCVLIDADHSNNKDAERGELHALGEIFNQNYLSKKNFKLSSFQNLEALMQVSKLKSHCNRKEAILDAMIVMNQIVNKTAEVDTVPKLEIEFDNEMGSGAGPTQEFYSLVVEEITNFKTKEGKILENINGYLYPAARFFNGSDQEKLGISIFKRHLSNNVEYVKEANKSLSALIFQMFKVLGQLCASALIDNKVFSLPMHPLFWLLCQQPYIEPNCSLAALKAIDPALAQSLENLYKVENLEESDLFFSYNGIPIVPGGDEIKVTNENLDDYIQGIVKLRCYDGVKMQIWAFRMGMATILPLETLAFFTPNELADDVFGVGDQSEYWTLEHLQMHIIPDHGYDASSLPYRELISTLGSLSPEERRMFIKFCTGAPILPKRGFAGLTPVMKVVNKGDNNDELPSVMTCSNYLKLPNYKSGEQLRKKLMQAIDLGQGSFNFS